MSRIYTWGLALLVAPPIAGLSLDSKGAADRRSYVAGGYALTLDGDFAGFVKSMSGGGAVAEVVTESTGATGFAKKHVGGILYEDIQIDVGIGAGASIASWIAASWQAQPQRKNGAIVAYDHKLDAVQSTEFTDALLMATTIPACDAASKEPAYLSLRIAPERTQPGKAAGKGHR